VKGRSNVMRILDYLQNEIREVYDIKPLESGEYQLIYNNETVKRKRYEFRELDKVYKCIKGFLIERCDDDGFTIDGEDYFITEGSLWVIPEDKDYRFIGGEVRFEHEEHGWIEISKEHLNNHFKEI